NSIREAMTTAQRENDHWEHHGLRGHLRHMRECYRGSVSGVHSSDERDARSDSGYAGSRRSSRRRNVSQRRMSLDGRIVLGATNHVQASHNIVESGRTFMSIGQNKWLRVNGQVL